MTVVTSFEAYLDRLPMHRLTMYSLAGMAAWAVAMSMAGVMLYSWWDIAGAVALAVAVAVGVNHLLARLLRATTDPQSSVITGLIVAMLVPVGLRDHGGFLVAAAAVAVASKYIATVDRQHIFNPAALAVAAIPMLSPDLHATWWIGTAAMLPAVVAFGMLIVLKTRRTEVVLTFLSTFLLIATTVSVWRSGEPGMSLDTLWTSVVSTALLYFAFVMLTDPASLPSNRAGKYVIAALVGVLYATPDLRPLGIVATPEVALCVGNAVSFMAGPRYRLELALKAKARVGRDVWEFVFAVPCPIAFAPGQYMEWTVPHPAPDGRGQRRHFTIASSPTEGDLKIVMRVPERCSTYKRALVSSGLGARVVAARLAGDFVLPRDLTEPMAFLAGGVGVAPFRSMARYITDGRLRCDIVLLYFCHSPDEFLFADVFEAAERHGMRSVCLVTGRDPLPAGWNGKVAGLSTEAITTEIPDFRERTFFLSGSHGMVNRMEGVLRAAGVRRRRIRKDYFDGSVDSNTTLPVARTRKPELSPTPLKR